MMMTMLVNTLRIVAVGVWPVALAHHSVDLVQLIWLICTTWPILLSFYPLFSAMSELKCESDSQSKSFNELKNLVIIFECC